MTDWLTYQEAADELGISERTLRRRVTAGYIRKIRPGGGRAVITRAELEAHRASPEHRAHERPRRRQVA